MLAAETESISIPNLVEEEMADAIQDHSSVAWNREGSNAMDLLPFLGSGLSGNDGVFSSKAITVDGLCSNREFNWNVIKEPISRAHAGMNRKIFTHSSIVRADTGKQIGLVNSNAKILQNKHLFEFVRPFVDSGSFEIDAVRSVDGGRSVVVVMSNSNLGRFEAFSGDPIEAFTFARLTRGSTAQINIGSMAYRLVCSNGMMGWGITKHKIDTSKPIGLTGKSIAHIMEQNAKQAAEACKKMKEMAKISMTTAQNDEYFRRACNLAWNDPELEFDCKEDSDKHQEEMEKTKKTVSKIFESTEFMKDTMSEDRHGTLECSWQGLTHYVSNKRSKSPDTAFRENHWGSGKRIRDRGYKLALEEISSRVIN